MKTKLSQAVKERWDKVTKKEMYELSFVKNLIDVQIAKMYGVPKSAVTYKRTVKFGLKRGYNSEAFRMYCRDMVRQQLKESNYTVKEKKKYSEMMENYFKDVPESY